ncbi:hypothetical protein BKA65DRAFT_500644 [Rhexocercosporidium sp. MPI-PUGE-AT-0058]|nr:hypothetical protein BKA65DRAFT_500644 [Rhexocercosporidium sp. MPI-PUGE-AT-0058]
MRPTTRSQIKVLSILLLRLTPYTHQVVNLSIVPSISIVLILLSRRDSEKIVEHPAGGWTLSIARHFTRGNGNDVLHLDPLIKRC